MIDLRSDTVTKPTAAMRRAMAEAEVGDDVYGEDPTINRLEERAANRFGKQAALFVPTGTMANTIALKLLSHHGEEVICDSRAHILDWELSMTAWFAGLQTRAVQTVDGILTWPLVAPSVKPRGGFVAPTAIICIENTHNMAGGVVYPQDVIDSLCDEAHARGIKIHMDGARVFNASIASGVPVDRIAAKVDTAMFCLSKGLGAPVGSILVGEKDAIAEGRNLRKRLGGGMRQAGILAAAGLIALEEMPKRLHEDHANARAFAEGITDIPGIEIDPTKVLTNIAVFDIAKTGLTPAEILGKARASGLLINTAGGTRLRALTHYGVTRAECETAAFVLRSALRG